jgi:hypothetical protein
MELKEVGDRIEWISDLFFRSNRLFCNFFQGKLHISPNIYHEFHVLVPILLLLFARGALIHNHNY